mmetsp:Transcript_7644/g.24317  ORF Transcript_7644/g.24317 Transcript_7644/m.24317 type:complete len:319 (-) Transcript_7644:148-1104(-)
MQLHSPAKADLLAAARRPTARCAQVHRRRREGLCAVARPRGWLAILPGRLLQMDQQATGGPRGAELRAEGSRLPSRGIDAHDRDLPQPRSQCWPRRARRLPGPALGELARGGHPDQGAQHGPEAGLESSTEGLPVPEPDVHEAEAERGEGADSADGHIQRQEGLRSGAARDVAGVDYTEAGHQGPQPAQAHRGPGQEGLQPGVHGRLRAGLAAAGRDLHPVLQVRLGLVALPPRQGPQPVLRQGMGAARSDLREGAGLQGRGLSLRARVGVLQRVVSVRGVPAGVQLPEGQEVRGGHQHLPAGVEDLGELPQDQEGRP